jgi:hypothetical protein
MTSGTNGQSNAQDLFLLTDEQILEIDPEPQDVTLREDAPSRSTQQNGTQGGTSTAPPSNQPATDGARLGESGSRSAEHASSPGAIPTQPPAWLAETMNDPQRGGEARALWEGAQRAQNEASAYREIFAKPEDARTAAQRARLLDDIDRAYFGAQGGTADQARASRTQLAAMMLREDPAAFREMVFEGLRALEAANVAAPVRAASAAANPQVPAQDAGAAFRTPVESGVQRAELKPGAVSPAQEAQLAAYGFFEKAANEELERSVGSAIDRALQQALPNLSKEEGATGAGARESVPLRSRLGATIRDDVEKALQGDRQLGEQIAQILSARRFDNETRAQVVRLIGERAQQLVPGAAKRALNDWTQATLAAHRMRSRTGDAQSSRVDLSPATGQGSKASAPTASASRNAREEKNRATPPRNTAKSSRLDYRRLSDEQILDS